MSRREPRTVSRAPAARAAFTLIEVMVALSISGLVLLGARWLLTGLADDADRITRAAALADHDANAERVLRALFAGLEVGTDSTRTFEGSERHARFTTWCDAPAGWQERCEALLQLDSLGGAPGLRVTLSTGEVIPLRGGFARGSLRYLSDARAGGTWFRRWGRGIVAPPAVGVVIDGDTLILRIGERG